MLQTFKSNNLVGSTEKGWHQVTVRRWCLLIPPDPYTSFSNVKVILRGVSLQVISLLSPEGNFASFIHLVGMSPCRSHFIISRRVVLQLCVYLLWVTRQLKFRDVKQLVKDSNPVCSNWRFLSCYRLSLHRFLKISWDKCRALIIKTFIQYFGHTYV